MMADTLPEHLLHWAGRTPDTVFIGEPDRGRTYTYGEVAGAVARFRAVLRRLAVSRGDRLAILGDNGASWVVAYLGALAHGAVAVPLNARHAAGDLGRALGDCEPAAIVGDPAYIARLSERDRAWAIDATELCAVDAAAPTLDGSDARPDEVGLLCYTSGTTGNPRGVMIRNASLVRSAATFAQIFQSDPDTRTAVVCPLFHNTGYNDGLAHMLLVNGRVDVPRRFDPEATAQALTEGRYPFLIGVPTIYHRMLARLEAAPPPVGRTAWFAYGGAPMPGPLAARLAELVPRARF